MKNKTIIFIVIFLMIIVGCNKKEETINKESNNKRYTEIKENIKIAVEKNIKAQYPNCPISYDNKEGENVTTGTSYNSDSLINNGYLKKEELLDIDKESYCDVFVRVRVKYENPQDHQHNCTTYYNTYLKCENYEEEGYLY